MAFLESPHVSHLPNTAALISVVAQRLEQMGTTRPFVPRLQSLQRFETLVLERAGEAWEA